MDAEVPILDAIEATARTPRIARKRGETHERAPPRQPEERLDLLVRLDRIVLPGQQDDVVEGGGGPHQLVDSIKRTTHVSEPYRMTRVELEEVNSRKSRKSVGQLAIIR